MSSRDKTSLSASGSKASKGGRNSSRQSPSVVKSPTRTAKESRGNKGSVSTTNKCTSKSIGNKSKPSGSNQRDSESSRQTHFFKTKTNNDIQSSQEMATTSSNDDEHSVSTLKERVEQETNVDGQQTFLVPSQDTDDDECATLLDSKTASSGSRSSSDHSSKDGAVLTSTTSNDLTPLKSSKITTQHSGSTPKLPNGWEQHNDNLGSYYWHAGSGVIQRRRPTDEPKEESLILYHDDEEINQASTLQKTSSEEEDYSETGAALTLAEESSANALEPIEVMNFVVYPVGCCEFDETQLVSASNTRAIQKCILRLSNNPIGQENMCWGLDQSQPILMRLRENYIQFFDLTLQALFKSQPINGIKTWAVDDDNNFAFVVEERPDQSASSANDLSDYHDSVDYALLTGPTFLCYVFRSTDDDDMSCKVAAKLNEEITKYKEQLSNRISKSTRLQQMIDSGRQGGRDRNAGDQADSDPDDDNQNDQLGDQAEEVSEMTMLVKYIGRVQVPRPIGIDVLNVAIDKSLADASKLQMNRLLSSARTSSQLEALCEADDQTNSPLIEAKLHVSPSSVIVENTSTGEIIVECRIRYLTFMGISRRDIRWCGFIMQNTKNKTFEAHCFECYPTAGLVCDAIQASCSKMYEKMVKSQQQRADDTTSIMPKGSRIRDTLAKTLSKIKLAPIIH